MIFPEYFEPLFFGEVTKVHDTEYFKPKAKIIYLGNMYYFSFSISLCKCQFEKLIMKN